MKISRRLAAYLAAFFCAFGVTGCTTLGQSDAYSQCVNAALIGAIIGAALDEDDRLEGALIGAAAFGLGCGIYKHMNSSQVQEMEEGTDDFLTAAPAGDVEGAFEIEGGTVTIRSAQAQGAKEFLSDEQLAAAGAGRYRQCRPTSREVTLESGTRLDVEHVYCLTDAGDWVPVTSGELEAASTT